MQDRFSGRRPSASESYPWYDSFWLVAYERAREILRDRVPGRLAEFDDALSAFRTRPGFDVRLVERIFDDARMDEIRRVAASLDPARLEMHEARTFRRFVVHDHPFFTELQREVAGVVGEAAGEEVEPSYNFLSLYGSGGVCPLHMDAPVAKWTLDLCLDQSGPWPIHFSPVVPWPEHDDYGPEWDLVIKRQHEGRFRSFTLEPGQAVLFSGSSQWHYRDPLPTKPGERCDLLFFHYVPKGLLQLAYPQNWAEIFGIPELLGLGVDDAPAQ